MKSLMLAVPFIMGALSYSAAIGAPQSARNLIVNSSFEALDEEGVPTAWNLTQNEGVAFLDKAVVNGNMCLRLKLDGRETVIGQAAYFKLTPGKPYTFSAYVKTRDLKPPSGLQLIVINLGWSFGYQSRLDVSAATADWKRYTRTFVCPAADQFKYSNQPNVDYKVVIYAKDVHGEVWLDAIQLEEGAKVTEYKARERKSASGDVIYDGVVEGFKRGLKRAKYFEVKEPLFEELLGDKPGPKRVLYYGYEDLWPEVHVPYAKKFGYRHVLTEERDAIRARPMIPMTNAWARGGVGTYPTMRMIQRHDVKGVAPTVINGNPWPMDPRWLNSYIKTGIRLAEQSKDKSPGNTWGNSWGLWAGDEVFESFGIKVVPKDRRYAEVDAADKEVREKFGFGKYGMPESEDDKDPFRRIAYRRWVNAKLTETYIKAHNAIKGINPDLKLLGPNPCGCVPPVDLEAMTPYFDLISNQAWYSPRSFVWQLATGADAKAMADLSSCPVWVCVQHAAAFDPEEVREQYSQVFRNGSHGLIVLGVEWYDRELEHVKLVNPPKWRAMIEIVDTVTKMNQVRTPEPDTAMLYASDTYLTCDNVKMASDEHPQVYAAYAALGPLTGSWFSFVSDRQIVRGQRDLGDYRVLYVPYAAYQREVVLDKVAAYARAGGIVVCTDPNAFTWNINGDDLSAKWAQITGVNKGKPREGEATARTVNNGFLRGAAPISLTFPGPGVEFAAVDASVKPLAVFADGSTAVSFRRYGKGAVILFAADPFNSQDRNTPMAELIKAIQVAAGAKVDRDIWRFKLPPFKTVYLKETETHKCLTMNSLFLERNEVKGVHNVRTRGTYTYDRFPTGLADEAASGDIVFFDGHLTNRKKAYMGRKMGGTRNPADVEKWIVSWTDREPVRITFDLKRPYALDRVRIFYSGILPELRVEGSNDGRTWRRLASHPPQQRTDDVVDITVRISGRYRYVRLALAARKSDAAMELAELEIWGNE